MHNAFSSMINNETVFLSNAISDRILDKHRQGKYYDVRLDFSRISDMSVVRQSEFRRILNVYERPFKQNPKICQ
jgi:hypothetical protein